MVHALDELRSGCQGGGKQSYGPYSAGCHYTRVTGIWQTVWLEAVDPAALASCRITPGADAGVFALEPRFRLDRRGFTFTAILSAEGRELTRVTVPAATGVPVTVPVPSPRLWCPSDPFLYDFVFEVRNENGGLIDRVESYAGLRKVHIEGNMVYLNNEPVFQRLVLDQGFYPDGIWTAPSDAALKRDIELSLEAGFNGARLHQKVFEERYFYWADKLGYLTWGEYPSWGLDWHLPEARYRYLEEWLEVISRDVNHPSIVAWSPLNESAHPSPETLAIAYPDQATLERYRTFVRNIYDRTKCFDPTRPVNDSSGYIHAKTDLWTVHPYRATAAELKAALRPADSEVMAHAPKHECAYTGQPYIVDEWGGFKFIPESHRRTGGCHDRRSRHRRLLLHAADRCGTGGKRRLLLRPHAESAGRRPETDFRQKTRLGQDEIADDPAAAVLIPAAAAAPARRKVPAAPQPDMKKCGNRRCRDRPVRLLPPLPRRSAGAADDQPGRQDFAGERLAGLQILIHGPCGEESGLFRIVADGGERRIDESRKSVVVETDDRQIRGNPEPRLPRGGDGAERDLIVGGHQCGERLSARQQFPHGPEAELHFSAALDAGNRQRGVETDAGFGQRLPVSVEPFAVIRGGGTADDIADPAVAETDQVAGRLKRTRA